MATGALCVQIDLPSYRSVGTERRFRLIYDTARANPRPVLPFNVAIPPGASVPPLLSYALTLGSTAHWSLHDDDGHGHSLRHDDDEDDDAAHHGHRHGRHTTFVDSSALAGGADDTRRAAVTAAARHVPTGVYPFAITATSHYESGDLASVLRGRVLIVNGRRSAIGTGWGILGVWRLHRAHDAVIVTSGEGGALVFTADGAGWRRPANRRAWSVRTTTASRGPRRTAPSGASMRTGARGASPTGTATPPRTLTTMRDASSPSSIPPGFGRRCATTMAG